MTPIEAGLVLAWLTLLLLGSAFAGLVVRFAELRRETRAALSLLSRGEVGADMPPHVGVRLDPRAHHTLRTEVPAAGGFVALVVDGACGACRQAAADLAQMAEQLAHLKVLILYETEMDLKRSPPVSGLPGVVSSAAWTAIPGSRPVVVVGNDEGSTLLPVSNRDDLLQMVGPHLSSTLHAVEGG